jgi:TRAP-type C4-dicarboxylate transport system substrate-binding protein
MEAMMNLRKRTTFAAIGVATVLLAGCASSPGGSGDGEAEVVTIRVATVTPEGGVEVETLKSVAEAIEEKSDGTLKLEVYASGQLGSTSDVAEQAASGESIIGMMDAGTLAGLGNDDLSILGGPFLFENAEQAATFSTSDVMQEMADTLATEGGVRILALNWLDGPRHLFGQEAYPEPEDLKGVKLRTPPIETWDRTFKPLGAVTTTVDSTEVYSALEQGVVEAAEGPINGTADQKWQEVAPVVTLTQHFRTFIGYAMGEGVFQDLSAEHQDLLIEEFTAGGQRAMAGWEEATDKNLELFEEQGVEVHEADIPAYQEATEGFYESYGDLLQRVRDAGK